MNRWKYFLNDLSPFNFFLYQIQMAMCPFDYIPGFMFGMNRKKCRTSLFPQTIGKISMATFLVSGPRSLPREQNLEWRYNIVSWNKFCFPNTWFLSSLGEEHSKSSFELNRRELCIYIIYKHLHIRT